MWIHMEDESLLWTSNDVVIVLQHGSEKIPLSYVSKTERLHVVPSQVQRHIVAGLASVVGGLSAPYERVSHIHERPVVNWLLAAGCHPFGPFSNVSRLSQLLQDVTLRGDEGRLTERFATSVEKILSDDMRYYHFDFHKICGHVHFERLCILYDQMEDFLIKNRYYLINDKGEKVETQIGIVRTNCIDCLDRTNVTQSMIGRKMLEIQLQRLGLFDADESISTHSNFDDCFKMLWADHGDDISIQYSGTPALKGDFVRVGKRTTKGILKDGWNALMRYYLNNFVDGTKQDSIDLVQGNYIVSLSRDLAPNLKRGGLETIAPFPVVLGLILMGILFSLLSLIRVRNDYWQFPLSIFWATSSIATIKYVKANSRAFCNRPRLHKPTS